METEAKRITSQEFHKMIKPQPGWIAIQKDKGSDLYGGFAMTETMKRTQLVQSNSGVIVAVSDFDPKEEYEQLLAKIYQVGDRITFRAEVVIPASMPPYCQIDNPDRSPDATIMVHIVDVLGFWIETEAEQRRYQEKIELWRQYGGL